ncbi:MAG: Bug family tripartite tricarboxylate transporter substrate binding protein [Burkholderiales bacterium]
MTRRSIQWTAFALVVASAVAVAQDYPNKPIRIIVPFPPGGATDIPARLIAPKLTEALGQPVVIENRAGAGGIIGVEMVAKAAPDGYTLLMATNADFAMTPYIYPKLPYDPFKAFTPISVVVESPMLLVVPTASPYNSLADIIAAAKAKPGTVSYSTAGTGSTSHVLTEMLASDVGIQLLHVPYKGGAPAAAAIATGEVAMGLHNLGSSLNYVKGGKAKAIAVTSAKRHPSFPEWPTAAEAGVQGYTATIWIGMAAPAGTPMEIVNRMSTEVARAVRSPDLRERFTAIGNDPLGTTPEEAATRIKQESARYSAVIKQANIRSE